MFLKRYIGIRKTKEKESVSDKLCNTRMSDPFLQLDHFFQMRNIIILILERT